VTASPAPAGGPPAPPPTLDDAALVERLRAGDAAALEPLMARYGARLYRVALGITRSHPEAEEVVQDAFLTCVRKIHMFEGRSALGTWLYRVTANAALLRCRARRADRSTSLDEHLPAFEADGHRTGERAWLLADWSALPDESLLAGERRRIVEECIERLPASYRAVLVLRDVEALSNEEVAAALDESVAAVKSRLHRARMALRELLTRRLGPDA
jgi:RNA polymerase sigma-70 factor (ECF subfamily)